MEFGGQMSDRVCAMLIVFVIVLSSFIASFSDWLFMDVLVHRFYLSSPDVWRPRGGRVRIILSQIIGTAASAGVVALCLWAPGRPVPVAVAAWVAGPLPVILQNLQWMRLHPGVAGSHAVGWLIRLLVAALLASWLLPP
jgi:hypothetical protein